MESQCSVGGITFGTGYSVFRSILPAIEQATESVTLVTCFWAASPTRDALNESLLILSDKALQRGKKARVRICFSSSSFFQKLFHTSSPDGKTYPPSVWHSKLGLPEHGLEGLDLEVKSIFFLPFSVWHPKFVIIDDNEVFLPSCNVSWEDWFEGCVRLNGAVVEHFITFWKLHWAGSSERHPNPPLNSTSPGSSYNDTSFENVAGKFLPSLHHRDPSFRWPWQACAPPPQTPLNVELLRLFATADKEIRIQSPNLTCAAVLDALEDALKRGVGVKVVTSERLMILEQLVTAGTTTSMCIKRLISKHQQMLQIPWDVEAGGPRPGRLAISYYEPRAEAMRETPEPVQSHLKLTMIDETTLVLGSGNMDRASWFTSQELGVAFYSTELALEVSRLLSVELKGRTKLVYDSSEI
ncbi:uncharacterized protein RCC_08142 [Ramularia collo-cygni]|uniref:PLD phosphodiesterase domain-containing protein n=1 Tax=Ramularia collo-cygni TaxID=112498 RepID=A0A2D3VLT5_9PEZI|nr:uncharacterized protein RCC_08142 [Ramularia collo-cygni]CZT22273.1 uncharacterized protein RCC_08142 [Ramularia collo-cygni]